MRKSSQQVFGCFFGGSKCWPKNYTTWHYSVMVLYPIRDVLWGWWPPYNPPGSVEDPRISIRSWSTFPEALPPNSQVTTLQTHPKNPSTPSQLLPTRRKRVTCKSLATTSAFFGASVGPRWFHYPVVWIDDWASQKKTIQGMREKYPFLKQVLLSQLDENNNHQFKSASFLCPKDGVDDSFLQHFWLHHSPPWKSWKEGEISASKVSTFKPVSFRCCTEVQNQRKNTTAQITEALHEWHRWYLYINDRCSRWLSGDISQKKTQLEVESFLFGWVSLLRLGEFLRKNYASNTSCASFKADRD